MKNKQLKAIYAEIPKDKQKGAKMLIDELEFLIATMNKLKEEINETGSTITVENYSQKFVKVNPALDQYNKLVSNYHKLLTSLMKLVPDKVQIQTDGFDEFLNS